MKYTVIYSYRYIIGSQSVRLTDREYFECKDLDALDTLLGEEGIEPLFIFEGHLESL